MCLVLVAGYNKVNAPYLLSAAFDMQKNTLEFTKKAKYSNKFRYCIVHFLICLFICNLQMLAHCLSSFFTQQK